jgi:oligosaccharide repeat unit polymerase
MTELPDSYFIAVALCVLLLLVTALNRGQAWALPFGAVTATISAWYLVEPFYFPELFLEFKLEQIQTAYDSVCIFCIALLVVAPAMANRMRPRTSSIDLSTSYIPADKVLVIVTLVWLVLLAFGIWRVEGDIIAALFPIGGRTGANMWGRGAGADAGSTGFLVSFAAYLYLLCSASFGVLFFFVRKRSSYLLLVLLVLISWPYSFLQGSRTIALATVVPSGLAFILFSRVTPIGKLIVVVGGLLVLDLAMRLMIKYRGTGFAEIDLSAAEESSHLGLNMASELVYITTFLSDGTLSLSYGVRYLSELMNVIPRAIWPEKPLIGIDYAIARGFGGASTDIGVFATISSGVIGQGVMNFGPIFGPIAAAALMSIWIGTLARFRLQGTPLRLVLYLVGLGLTFNLGRDITLLVLWPIVFGYFGVRAIEWRSKRFRASTLASSSTSRSR